MPLQAIITKGTTADCTKAHELIVDMPAEHLLADRGYDSNKVIDAAHQQNMKVVTPPRGHRKEQRTYDKDVYRMKHLVEDAFLYLKRWKGIATRYAKNMKSFLETVQIRCRTLYMKNS